MGISKDLQMELWFAEIKVYIIFSEHNQQPFPILPITIRHFDAKILRRHLVVTQCILVLHSIVVICQLINFVF